MNCKRSIAIACAMLTLLCVSACGTTTKATARPEGFCQRLPVPPAKHGHIVDPAFAKWVDDVYIRFDCTCPGGLYYGKRDALCEGK